MTEPTETVRLHITPLTSELLPAVLPPSVRSTATDISFHTIATFPENNYGYVTLPKMDAEKIKKKLNGSILKGKKFKIDTARPHKRQLEEETEPEPTKEKKKSKKSKSSDNKSIDDKNTVEGYELPSDRKVKRGWTEPGGSKKDKRRSDKSKSKDDKKEKPQPKSKYTEKAECLFRTNLPPNKAAEAEEDKKSKKKKTKSSETVVHEFAKTYTQPSFLRSRDDGATPTATFDEEKGWMDKSGNVKETTSEKARKKDYWPGKVAGAKEKRPVLKKSVSKAKKEESPSSESEDWTSSSGSSDEGPDSDSESESESEDEDDDKKESEKKDSSSEDSDSSMQDDTTEKPSQEKADKVDTTTSAADESDSDDSDDSDESMPEAAEKSEVEPVQDDNQNESKEVHPLEALFKRPAEATETQPEQVADTGFSFFGNNDDIESDEESRVPEPQTPFTPFSKRDIQDRGLRSAAPTPDTAVANRHMTWNEMEDDDDDEELSIDTPVSKPREGDKEETQFAKWFWENRGDNNRAWKKRRRDAAKEQRQRENRKKGMKGKS